MKKLLIIATIVGVVVLALGIAGYTYARAQAPVTSYGPWMMGAWQQGNNWRSGPGMMGGWQQGGGPGMMGGGGFGMMGGYGGYGPLHDYMFPAIAEALGLTPEELQAQIDAGKTPYQIAQEQGLTDEPIRDLFEQAHDAALAAAVEAGVITQEQAEWMDEHHEQMWANCFGPGFGGCHGGWGNPQPTPQP